MARVFREKKSVSGVKLFIYVIAAIAALILIWYAASSLGSSQGAESEKIAKEAIVRAAVQCYSLEGRYPPSLEYLEANYGLTLDRTKYVYYYQSILGSNAMPDIQMFPLGV
jgi:hypothetical protein